MAALVGAAIVAGGTTCAAAPETNAVSPTTTSHTTATFERVVNPFVVLDEHGAPYDLAFLGGTDVPRPNFADIDGDGDYDLFVQEYPEQLWFFENTGSARTPKYEWRTNRYHDVDIGEWFRFYDIDADGDLDLLAEMPFSYIRLYRNDGTPKAAHFAKADSLRAADGTAMFMDRQNIPAFGDIDCDQKLDFLVGRVEGTVSRYEAISPGSEKFVLQEDQFQGIEVIGQTDSTGTQRHGANALALADFDSDGDLDLFWGDYFERGALLIENVGRTCSTPTYSHHVPLPYADTRTSGYNIPAPVDIDRDGDMDFLMGVLGGAFNPFLTATNNLYFWERTSVNAFTFRTSRFLYNVDIGSESAPAIADIDGDGDLDMIVGNKLEPANNGTGRLHVMMNEGTRTAPRYRMTDTLAVVEAFNQKPALGDLDGDGDQDMLMGTWNTGVLYFRNDGTAGKPRFTQEVSLSIQPPKASNCSPALADLDGDGDLDLMVGEANGELSYYRNDGSAREASFVLVSEKMDDIDVGRSSAPAFVDMDGDGLQDMVLGREVAGAVVYRNVGTKSAPKFADATANAAFSAFVFPLPPLSTPLFADMNGDGVIDMVSGTSAGGLLYFRGGSR